MEQGTTSRCVFVLSDIDDHRYKLVVSRDLRSLGTKKIKRHLEKASGLLFEDQVLTFNGRVLSDDLSGGDIGLFDGAILHLHQRAPSAASNDILLKNEQALRSSSGTQNSCSYYRGDDKCLGSSQNNNQSPENDLSTSPVRASGRSEHNMNRTSATRRASGDSSRLMMGRSLSVVSSGRSSVHNPRLSRLESENEALQYENKCLQGKMLDAERRAANAINSWSLQEEIGQLRDRNKTLERKQQHEEAKWRLKEEELVKELDLLREERRTLRKEQLALAEEQHRVTSQLQEKIHIQAAQLNEKDKTIQQLLSRTPPTTPVPVAAAAVDEKCRMPLHTLVQRALDCLSATLGIGHLALDDANTCMFGIGDDLTALITLDESTERLFLYTTLLTYVPPSPEIRLCLYERLLEGSLLGKEVAGGGIGICRENDLILLSTSVDVRQSEAGALASIVRPFIESAVHWVEEVERLTTVQQ